MKQFRTAERDTSDHVRNVGKLHDRGNDIAHAWNSQHIQAGHAVLHRSTTQHTLETQPLPCLLRYPHPQATILHTPETQARTFSTDPEMHATPKRQHSSPPPSQRPPAPRQPSTGSAAPYPKQKTGTAKHRRPGHRRRLNNAMRRPSTGTRRPERAPYLITFPSLNAVPIRAPMAR